MRVPEYKEQYRYTTSHGGGRIQGVHGGQNADTQSLLMAGKSMQGLGDSLMKASNQIYKTEDYVAKAKAEKQANELSNAFMAKQTEFEKLKGENALNVSEDFETWRKEQLQLAQQTLGDNERALAYFNMSADNSYASQKRWVDNYQAGQKEVFLDGTFQSSLDTKANEFLHNINNPELMMQAKSDGFGLIQEYVRRKGLGEEVAKQMYRDWISNNFSKGVSLFIDNENLGRARSLLDYGKDYLGADQYASLKKKISNEQERLNAKAQVQQFNNQVNGLVGNGLAFVQKNINTMSKEELLLEAEKISKQSGSYEIQEKVYSRLKSIINDEEEKKENRVTVFGNNLLNSSNTTEENIAVIQDAADKGLITNDIANNLTEIILKKDVKTTDWKAYNEAQQNITNGVYIDYNDFIEKTKNIPMTYKDRQELQKFYENKYDPIQKKYVTDMNDALAIINPKPKKPTEEQERLYEKKQETITALFNFYKNEFVQANGRLPNRTECYDIVHQIEQERNIDGGFANQFMTIANEYTETTGRSMVADNLRENAKNLLFSNDIPVTKQNLLRVTQAKDMKLEIEAIKQGRPSTSENNETEISLLDVEDIVTDNPVTQNRKTEQERVRGNIAYNIKKTGYSTKHTDSLDFKPVEKGNIDPTNRPMVKLPSGETATVKTMSFEFGGLEVLVPTVRDDGYIMSDEEAIEHYRKTGKHFGKFKTIEQATKYAQALHLDQEEFYLNKKG